MLDIKYIRENKEAVAEAIKVKGVDLDLEHLLGLDERYRDLLTKVEEMRAEKNAVSKEIPQKEAVERESLIKNMKELDERLGAKEQELKVLKAERDERMLWVPQVPSPEAAVGKDDTENVEVRQEGAIPQFDFEIKDHVELMEKHDMLDVERGVKIGGSRSYVLKNDGVLLQQAVLQYGLEFIRERGFSLLYPPILVKEEALVGTGHFPEGREDVYEMEKDELFLAGTAEVPIMSYRRDEILEEGDLPLRYAGISSCFRREAGTYGKDTRGLYRVHQFEKVEQVVLCHPDKSEEMHQELLKNSEEMLKNLGLPYRVLECCTGDMGAGKVRMYDLEAWMPSRGAYGETHSCSNLGDWQARRVQTRFKDGEGEIRYVHTLNNTVIANPRILIPIIECNQNADGSINIPPVLQPYMQGREKIG